MNSRPILVPGGTGKIGRRVAAQLRQRGVTARASRSGPQRFDWHDEGIAFLGDVELPEYTKVLIEQAIAAGHATDSYARIIEHFKQQPSQLANRPASGADNS